MKTLVSIITPAYNAETHIEDTIKSVQQQTYQNWEMLITDDASKDNTCRIVQKFIESDPRVKLFKLDKNQGPAYSRNYSIQNAKGQFIAFLDADDLWYPEKLAIQVKAMLKNDVGVSFSSYERIDEDNKALNIVVKAIPNLTYAKLLRNNYIGNLTGMYDASRIGKIYHPELKKRQDWCLWLEALKKSNKPAIGIQEVLAKYRVRKDSVSSHKFQLVTYNFQVYHQYLKFSFLKSTAYLFLFLVEYFFVRPKYIEYY